MIPTTLRIEAPSGVTAEEIVWPPPIDLKQVAGDTPLSVFEREFLIGVKLSLAPATPPGDLHVPGKLRYQACDINLCYPPATADVDWVVHVVPAAAAAKPDRALAAVFSGIAFGTGEKPARQRPQSASAPSAVATPPSRDDVSLLDDFVVASTDGGYMSTSKFLTFIRNAEAGVKPRGMFEGRGPLAILLLVLIGGLALNLTPCVLPMIPINLAIIGAGAQAQSRGRGFLLGSAYGGAMAFVYGVLGVVVILTAGHVRHDQLVSLVQSRDRDSVRCPRPRDVRPPAD